MKSGRVHSLQGKGEQTARLGAYLHGLAGDLAEEEMGEIGIIAGDLLPRIPTAFRQIRGPIL